MTKEKSEVKKLIRLAVKARENAYAPYSGFTVGAALLTQSGEIFTGSNIENISYPAGICAERSAISGAVSAGHTQFAAIAISGGREGLPAEDYAYPCGICRQVMSEFCDEDFPVFLVKNEEDIREYKLKDLLPHAFTNLQLS